ncbi:MAG TPA: hypothetical protein PLG73_01270 [Candidatus Sumerlaeota bacterium]|nr:hypothetical protein [Candidatus Sumerlaeota bacterium]
MSGLLKQACVLLLALAAVPAFAENQISWIDDNGTSITFVRVSDGAVFTQDFAGVLPSYNVPYDWDGDGFDDVLHIVSKPSSNNGFGLEIWSPMANGMTGGVLVETDDLNVNFSSAAVIYRGDLVRSTSLDDLAVVVPGGGGVWPRLCYLDGRPLDANGNVVSDATAYQGYATGDRDGNGIDEIYYARGSGIWFREYDGTTNTGEQKFADHAGGDLGYLQLIGDVDGDGTDDVVSLNNTNNHIVYAPIDATIPATWTDSGMIAPVYPTQGVPGCSACFAVGQLDADPQEEIVYTNDDGFLVIVDLVDQTETELSVGPGDGSEYVGLSIGNFMPDYLVPAELSSFAVE